MVTCKDMDRLMVDYVDARLEDGLSRDLEQHLDDCPPCLEYMRSYKETPKLCREAMKEKAPAELKDRLKRFLRAKCCK